MAQVPGQTALIETGDHRVVVQAARQVDHTVLVDGRFVIRHARRNPTLGLLARGDRPDRSYRAAVGDLRISPRSDVLRMKAVTMERVVVTGGSGKLGRAVVRDLVEHGYAVINVDVVPSREHLCPFIQTDVEDMGQVLETMSQVDDQYKGVDAVVHLAAIPAPGRLPNGRLFQLNMISTFNVFEAARRLGIRNVVWASSETVLGLPFDKPPPYIPVDEEYDGRPETVYSLSKHLGEEMAR